MLVQKVYYEWDPDICSNALASTIGGQIHKSHLCQIDASRTKSVEWKPIKDHLGIEIQIGEDGKIIAIGYKVGSQFCGITIDNQHIKFAQEIFGSKWKQSTKGSKETKIVCIFLDFLLK